MRTTRLGAALAWAVLLCGCAGTRPLDCTEAALPVCDPTLGPCAQFADACRYVPPGASNAPVDIDSSPTPAAIYVDGQYVGKTPLRRYLWFSSTTHAVTVVAEPIYPGQSRQEQQLRVPPLPRRLTFFMNNAPTDREQEAIRR